MLSLFVLSFCFVIWSEAQQSLLGLDLEPVARAELNTLGQQFKYLNEHPHPHPHHNHRESKSTAAAAEAVAVVQVFWPHHSSDGNNTLPDYVWHGLRRSGSANGGAAPVNITLLSVGRVDNVPDDLPACVTMLNVEEYYHQDNALTRFMQDYQPWGMNEPWERQNQERFFLLRRFMVLHHMSKVFYMDSDVVLVNASFLFQSNTQDECDAVLSLRTDLQQTTTIMQWATNDWVAWAGSAILSRHVLDEYLLFVQTMYTSPYLLTLEHKRHVAPYVCDMTLWYLYAGAASEALRHAWGWPSPSSTGMQLLVPSTHPRRICDGNTMYHIDHKHGHLRPPHERSMLATIHYQGSERESIIIIT